MGRDDIQQIKACLRLWSAVMHFNIVEAKSGSSGGAARAWIANDENRPGSFVWICGLFDLAPDRVRRELAARRAEKVAAKPAEQTCDDRELEVA